jgi:hypothetical protein
MARASSRFGTVPKTFVDRCEELFDKYEPLNRDFFYLTTTLPMSEPRLKLPSKLADQIKPIREKTIKDLLNDVEGLRADFSKLEVIPGNKTI